MTTPATPPSSPADEILTVEEVAQRLRMPTKSVGNLLRARAFPGAFKAGLGSKSPWRIPESSLRAFIAKQQAAHQPEAPAAPAPRAGRARRVANRAAA